MGKAPTTAHKLRSIIDELSQVYLERETTLTNAVLALLARQHHFVVGPMGAAKSAVHEAVVARITGANFFTAQMHDAMRTDELFGQIDMAKYDQTNIWQRNTTGYLPWAHLAMIDEIDKGPHLLRSLLRVANERKWRNGDHEVDLPLITVVASANDVLPEEHAPVWDRFLIREQVDYIAEASNFRSMLTNLPTYVVSTDEQLAALTQRTTITLIELEKASLMAVPSVTVDDDLFDVLWDVRAKLREHSVVVSDRRWKDSVRLMQASAFLAGRTSVTVDDLIVLKHVLWSTLAQVDIVATTLLPHVNADQRKLAGVLHALSTTMQHLDGIPGTSSAYRISQVADLSERLGRIRTDLIGLESGHHLTAEWRRAQRIWLKAKTGVAVVCAGMEKKAAQNAAEAAWAGR